MSLLATKEERTEYRETHNTYFKCFIVGHWLSDAHEVWGYALTSDRKEAQRLFNKEMDEQLDDGRLDYGFAHIAQFKKINDHWTCVGQWVNYFGRWIKSVTFNMRAYGIKEEDKYARFR